MSWKLARSTTNFHGRTYGTKDDELAHFDAYGQEKGFERSTLISLLLREHLVTEEEREPKQKVAMVRVR